MEKNDIYYYEKDGEMYAMKKISEFDIENSIKESHYTYDIWLESRLSILRKLKYYSLQEDGYLYFEMKQSISDNDIKNLSVEEEICDKIIYSVPKDMIRKCADIFYKDNENTLWIYTDKNRFCDSKYTKPYYGKASVYDIASYLADRQYHMMINDHMYLTASEVYAVCDYPVFETSIGCEIRDIYKMNDAGYVIYIPDKTKGHFLKEYRERTKYHKEYLFSNSLDVAIDISWHIKESIDEIDEAIRLTKKMIEDGLKINLMFCVRNNEQKAIINEMIDDVINFKKTLH